LIALADLARGAIPVAAALRVEPAHAALADEVVAAVRVAPTLGCRDAVAIVTDLPSAAVTVLAATHVDALTLDARLEPPAVAIAAATRGAHALLLLANEAHRAVFVAPTLWPRAADVAFAGEAHRTVLPRQALDALPRGGAQQRLGAVGVGPAATLDTLARVPVAGRARGARAVVTTAHPARPVGAVGVRRAVVVPRALRRRRDGAVGAEPGVIRYAARLTGVATVRHAARVDADLPGATGVLGVAVVGGELLGVDADVGDARLVQRAEPVGTHVAVDALVGEAGLTGVAVAVAPTFEAGAPAAGQQQEEREGGGEGSTHQSSSRIMKPIRLFFARPRAVRLGAIGRFDPRPLAESRFAATPRLVK